MLELKNVSVEIENKKIINNFSRKFEKGKTYVVMGPNGSGKSTLALSIAGHPKIKIKKGEIKLKNKEISRESPDERAKNGIFISFQHPPEIEGVPLIKFLRQINNSKKKEERKRFYEFKKETNKNFDDLEIKKEIKERSLNLGFSGGEKKKSEILQMLALNPEVIILDEIDSGLDIDSLKTIAKKIKDFGNKNKTIIIITHYKRILDHLNIDEVLIMDNGKIVKEGDHNLVKQIEEKGYKNL
jgi:Fe-S cluster assembly ATP-binding protein